VKPNTIFPALSYDQPTRLLSDIRNKTSIKADTYDKSDEHTKKDIRAVRMEDAPTQYAMPGKVFLYVTRWNLRRPTGFVLLFGASDARSGPAPNRPSSGSGL